MEYFNSQPARRLAILLIFLILALTTAQTTRAQGGLEIIQDTARINFPRTIEFQLIAQAGTTIKSVELVYGVQAKQCGPTSSTTQIAFESTDSIDLSWRWDILEYHLIPPGSTVWWYWQLETWDGQILESVTQSIVFLDQWFVWQSIEKEPLTVYWYRGSQDFAHSMLDAGVNSLNLLAGQTGLTLEGEVDVYLYDEPLDLQISVPGAPAWAGGIAFPEHNIVLAVADEAYALESEATVRHEIGHVVIGQLTFNCLGFLPTWLSEGLATTAEGTPSEHIVTELNEAIAENKLIPLAQLESSFPIHAEKTALSYVQSESIVRFLLDEYGQEKMTQLLLKMRDGATIDDALTEAYGIDSNGLEAAWRVSIGAPSITISPSDPSTPSPVPTLVLHRPTESTAVTEAATKSEPASTSTQVVEPTASKPVIAVIATPTQASEPGDAVNPRSSPWLLVGYLLPGLGLLALLIYRIRQR